MLEWFKSLFKSKSKPDVFVNGIDTIVTDERVDIEYKATGEFYSFNIGRTSNNNWFALTDEEQVPKFCFNAKDRDDAYTKGIDAMNFYFEYLDAKKAIDDHR